MINQRTKILNKKGECLRPYARKNYGIQYPKIELDKINLTPEILQDDSFYEYVPTSNQPLQLISSDHNIVNQSTPSSLIPLVTNNNNQPSPLSTRHQKINYNSQSPKICVKRN
ncbi:unnamed protein product [Brachionus calyciflorus]|uniref:Uncharacterized protein n=1 Tax=Brachionus calyciflorus TaxID=104777 RepID=A0A814N5P7_9BILA|nr:unnamed protein product [Brachionus calyciflorus]